MPGLTWKPGCSCPPAPALASVRVCRTCGVPGTYAGYRISSAQEAWGRHARTYYVKPLGPHLAFAGALLKPLWETCDNCKGVGVLTRRFRWSYCDACNATGITWIAPGHEIVAAYRRIFERWPDAVITDTLLQHLKAIGACDASATTIEQALSIERPVTEPAPVAAEPPPTPCRSGLARVIRRLTTRSDDQACST